MKVEILQVPQPCHQILQELLEEGLHGILPGLQNVVCLFQATSSLHRTTHLLHTQFQLLPRLLSSAHHHH